jgi:CBS domain-containing protein
MKVRDLMTRQVVSVAPEESVEVAARTLTQYNVGILPVCDHRGKICGLVTDRDLVTRCLAGGRSPAATRVADVMTAQVATAMPDMEVGVAAHMMGRLQVRRLPVVENGRLCGLVSLGDLARREESVMDAADALADISDNLTVP